MKAASAGGGGRVHVNLTAAEVTGAIDAVDLLHAAFRDHIS
jgi:hypothetical protein